MTGQQWMTEAVALREMLSNERQRAAQLEIELSKLKAENNWLKRESVRITSRFEAIPDSATVGGV